MWAIISQVCYDLYQLIRNTFKTSFGIFDLETCLQWRIQEFAGKEGGRSRPGSASMFAMFTFFSWFGMIHLTKLGLVLLSVCISLVSCSLYSWPTVRNIPFLVRAPNDVSLAAVAPRPTISAVKGKQQKSFKSYQFDVLFI